MAATGADAAFENTTSIYPENSSQYGANVTLSADQELDMKFYAIFVPIVWGTVTFIGAFGNALVIFTLIRHGDKNATNYFVINLAISDFAFVVIVVPFTATLYVLPEWVFGEGMCKVTMYMIYVTLHATCLTLMAMTIDRYCAIVYAVQSRNWRTTTASMFVCLLVWLVSFVISLPFAIYFRTTVQPDNFVYCEDIWPEPKEIYNKASMAMVVMTTYVIPLTVIIYCYAMILNTLWRNKMQCQTNGASTKKMNHQDKRRKRVTKLVASVVIVFAVFWLPIHVINLWIKFDPDFPRTPAMYAMKIVSHTLSYSNSCVNPFVYAFLSDGFRKAFRKTFPSIVQRFKICGGPVEDCPTQVCLVERTEQSKITATTVSNNTPAEERRLMQTDL
ncbi:galanin receptor type 1-like [Dreissena polymorpha]|uniref:galanin receptor type 1-like n=1 Tax=Dreissena polymorpha TaxID=45954 RepID=UPI0022644984|nr:galanin receptor type 1-like [Dreissena polymorpha]